MDRINELKKMFSEIGLGDHNSIQKNTGYTQFDFDFSKYNNVLIQKIEISTNTKNQELCPIGTK